MRTGQSGNHGLAATWHHERRSMRLEPGVTLSAPRLDPALDRNQTSGLWLLQSERTALNSTASTIHRTTAVAWVAHGRSRTDLGRVGPCNTARLSPRRSVLAHAVQNDRQSPNLSCGVATHTKTCSERNRCSSPCIPILALVAEANRNSHCDHCTSCAIAHRSSTYHSCSPACHKLMVSPNKAASEEYAAPRGLIHRTERHAWMPLVHTLVHSDLSAELCIAKTQAQTSAAFNLAMPTQRRLLF